MLLFHLGKLLNSEGLKSAQVKKLVALCQPVHLDFIFSCLEVEKKAFSSMSEVIYSDMSCKPVHQVTVTWQ